MQVTWKDCLANGAAWDTLTWFAALIGMASYLNKYGFIKWFSNQVRCSHSLRFCQTPHHCLVTLESLLPPSGHLIVHIALCMRLGGCDEVIQYDLCDMPCHARWLLLDFSLR